ncbi:HNH endonuclease [Variovorax sp. PAMC 28711]|uniref:HNH endonuclease n=1 Tax=Variovorax sp. PAMC 28711 TaxID=1795631 RepID=UPI00078BD8A6|nr:HNH endonuclease signature motif containing protein [Variovorax sp. PAMC 28711]AMM23187.1 hypothetical protein AX767_01450 [Variovorax sp. PAMC 28711]
MKTEAEQRASETARKARWVAANPDKKKASDFRNNAKRNDTPPAVLASNARRAALNVIDPEPLRKANAAYYAANKEKIMEKRRQDPVARRAHDAKRRATKLGAGGAYTSADVQSLLRLQKSKCPVCRDSLRNGYHVDHVMALARGGSNDRLNLQLLCPSCNQSKGAKDPLVFANQRGQLC